MHVILTEQEYKELISQSKKDTSWESYVNVLEKKTDDIFNAGKKAMFEDMYNGIIYYLRGKGLDSEDIGIFMDTIRQRHDVPTDITEHF